MASINASINGIYRGQSWHNRHVVITLYGKAPQLIISPNAIELKLKKTLRRQNHFYFALSYLVLLNLDNVFTVYRMMRTE